MEIKVRPIHSEQDYEPALQEIVDKTGATGVLLAIPSASRRRRRQVLQRLSEFPVHVQTMPDIKDIVSGKARVDDVTDVEVEDLLGRDSVPPRPVNLRHPERRSGRPSSRRKPRIRCVDSWAAPPDDRGRKYVARISRTLGQKRNGSSSSGRRVLSLDR